MALLEQASMYIHLDPRVASVQVPPGFKNQPQLVLQVGLNMAVAIPDLHVDDQGLSCTLSFNRTPFFCMIPWPAVFALVGENGQAMVWAEDVPAEVAAQAQAQKAPEKPRTHLRSVGEGESAPAPAKAEPAAAEKKPAAKGGKAQTKAAVVKPEASKAGAKSNAKSKAEAKPPSPKSTKTAGKAPAKTAKSAADATAAKKPAASAPGPKAEPATAQAVPAKKPAASKSEAAGSAAEVNKPKRELPPYLRVVK